MRKALVLVFAMLISTGAMAQLNVISEKKSPEFLTENLIYNSETDKYTLFFVTSNQFDSYMQILLGDKEQAIKTLDDLISITEIKEQKDIEINNGYGEKFRIYTGYGAPSMCGDGYAACAKITSNILKTARNRILNISEKRTKLPDIVNVTIDLYYRNSDSLFYIKTKQDDTIYFALGNGKAAALENSRYIYNFKESESDTLSYYDYILVKQDLEFVNDFEIIYNNKKSNKINFAYMLMYEHRIRSFEYDKLD